MGLPWNAVAPLASLAKTVDRLRKGRGRMAEASSSNDAAGPCGRATGPDAIGGTGPYGPDAATSAFLFPARRHLRGSAKAQADDRHPHRTRIRRPDADAGRAPWVGPQTGLR